MDKRIPMIPRQVAEVRLKKYASKIRDSLILFSVYRNSVGFDINGTIEKLSDALTAVSRIRPNIKFSKEDYESILFPFGNDIVTCRRALADFKEVNVTMNHLYPDFVINRDNVPDLYRFTSSIKESCIPMFTSIHGSNGDRFSKVVKNILTGEK